MECADFMGLQGQNLTIAERTALTCSLPILAQQTGKQVSLWGKVLGFNNVDYLVAQAAADDFLDQPTSYYSIDGGVHWTVLETPNQEQVEFSAQIRGPFTGDPKYEYKLQKDLPPEDPAAADAAAAAAEAAALEEKPEDEEAADEDEAEDGEEGEGAGDAAGEEEGDDEEKKPVKRRPKFQILSMAEAVRLSYFILEHDRACKLVPRGAFLRGSDNIIVKNKAFKGLSVEDATQLKSFFKRKEQYDVKANGKLFGDNYAASRDFLCSIAHDFPEGTWALKYDDSLGVVTLNNLLFLGSMFYHKTGTSTFGQFYIGSGERNLDMLFMLP